MIVFEVLDPNEITTLGNDSENIVLYTNSNWQNTLPEVLKHDTEKLEMVLRPEEIYKEFDSLGAFQDKCSQVAAKHKLTCGIINNPAEDVIRVIFVKDGQEKHSSR